MAETGATAGELFRTGRLEMAIAAANAGVRNKPADLGSRILLAELLLFAGNLERADVILDAAAGIDPTAAVAVAEFRQLLRAEIARRQLRREGRVPEFLGEPTPTLRSQLAARVAWRAGDREEAGRCAREAEVMRPPAPGQAGDVAFDDFRDADDLDAGLFEVLTTTGKYFWLPTERLTSIDFYPPQWPRDLFWRRASVVVADGPDGDVYFPVLYDTEQPQIADELRLGRATDWVAAEDGLVQGLGQRVFVVGDDARAIMELTTLRFGR